MHSRGIESNFQYPTFQKVIIILEADMFTSLQNPDKIGVEHCADIVVEFRQWTVVATFTDVTNLWLAFDFRTYSPQPEQALSIFARIN